MISLAGPAAGFALAAAVAAAISVAGHSVILKFLPHDDWRSALPSVSLPLSELFWEPFESPLANDLVHSLFYINILWGLVNLLPVYPLDGGRVARELATIRDVPSGIALSLRISMVTAIGMALFAVFALHSWFVGVMFGYMAYMNYQTLQNYQQSRW